MDQKIFMLTFLDQEYQTHYITDKNWAKNILAELCVRDTVFGFDLETKALPKYSEDRIAPLDPLRSEPRLAQICDGERIFVFDLLFGITPDLFHDFLTSKRLLAHNAIFEIQRIIRDFKVRKADMGCTYLATKLLHHALYVDDGGIGAGLDDVVQSLFKVKLFKEIDHKFWGEPDLTFEQIEYAALDSAAVLKIAPKLASGLKKYGLEKVYKLYKDAQWPLAQMQLNGIGFDTEKHRELIAVWKQEAYQAKKELLKVTGLEEITSHTIASYLEKTLDPNILRIWPKTESGKLSTDANAFAEFSFVPIVEPFARFQKAATLSSTFGTKLLNKVSPVDGRLHGQFKLCGTRTGRLSSSNPNQQNYPRDPEFRSLFRAAPGHVLICGDFSQIELRTAAELSRDEEMLKAYRDGIDLHSLTAARTSGKSLQNVTKEDRQRAKALNFGLLFGLGSRGFQKYAKKQYKVELTENQAEDAVYAWHTLYAKYTEFQRNQADVCCQNKTVRTPLGKLRKLSEENYYGASANSPVQGGASECMLHALIYLYEIAPVNLVNTVHDEVILECENKEEVIANMKSILKNCMVTGFVSVFENGITNNLVEVGSGETWSDAK